MSENASSDDWKTHPLEHALASAASYGHLYGPDLSTWPDFAMRQLEGFTDYYETSVKGKARGYDGAALYLNASCNACSRTFSGCTLDTTCEAKGGACALRTYIAVHGGGS